MEFLASLRKEWKIISTIFAILGAGLTAGIHITRRVDTNQETMQSLRDDQQGDEKSADEQGNQLDDHEKRLIKLEEDERLREKGICK